jgi:hypothetical protein
MAKKNRNSTDGVTDVACVIHHTGYDWIYVDHLYNSVTKKLNGPIRFHVYTEPERSVPDHMIKHCLQDWPGIAGPKKSWWYKMQLFNPEHHTGNLLYIDLDCVIVNDLNWIGQLSTSNFWTIQDFRVLQKKTHTGMNSSVMWWNVPKFAHVWQDFVKKDIGQTVRHYAGDQDYIGSAIPVPERRHFDAKHIQSWRWQVADGGYDFAGRKAKRPGTGAGPYLTGDTSILVFHGKPKPHECVADPIIANNWC